MPEEEGLEWDAFIKKNIALYKSSAGKFYYCEISSFIIYNLSSRHIWALNHSLQNDYIQSRK